MSDAWPEVRLGDVLHPVSRPVSPEPTAEYRLLGVRLDGQGPFLRESVTGAQTSATTLFHVQEGDFIYSRLFAWRGAFGIIDRSLHGCFVSSEFPTFHPSSDRLDLRFLRYWFRLPGVLRRVEADCSGSTPLTRNRFKEEFFSALVIPLPPLAEQRRIVARLDALAAKIEEAKRLRLGSSAAIRVLNESLITSFGLEQFSSRPLGELIAPGSTLSYGVLVPGPDVDNGVPFVRVQDLSVEAPTAIPNKRIAPEIEAPYARTRLRGGEVLLGVVGAIGKLGIAPASWAGANIARAVCRIAPGPDIDRDFLIAVLQSPKTQRFFREATRTLAQPTLNIGQLEHTPIPVPPLTVQRELLVRLQDTASRVQEAVTLSSRVEVGLSAAMPSALDRAFAGAL